MDGYAVRAADVARIPAPWRSIGSQRGRPALQRRRRAGEAVRIFTGAPVPEGADTIVIQENADARRRP